MKPVEFRIIEQGAVRVNVAHLFREGIGIAAIYVDLHSKRAEAVWTGSGDCEPPSVSLGATEHTLILDESKSKDSITTIDFPEYVGWRVFVCEVSRYTLSVCLVATELVIPIEE